ncbi:MAG: guanylate kinase [Ignavibacteria bacterium]|nr:guanylate kinase [Ignavibacteria bacterium]
MAPGKLIVISAPSGAGKTTIAGEILKRVPVLSFSVSATTRAQRAGEVEGRDYFFLSPDQFTRGVEGGAFVEWEELFGNRYGTPKAEIDRAMLNGEHLLFDIDVKGALAIKRQYPAALLIFILPPDMEVLKQRLSRRKTEDTAALQRRLDRVPMELEQRKAFDRIVVNDALDKAVDEVEQIIQHHLHHEQSERSSRNDNQTDGS